MAQIIDGKLIAAQVRQEVLAEVVELKTKNVQPHLSVILVGDNPASQVYVRNKGKACEEVGITSETMIFPKTITQNELLDLIQKLNENPNVHGILVQLPLPKHINEDSVIQTISPNKDVDGFHPVNVGKLASGFEPPFVPCTPAGVVELLLRTQNPPDGKHVVIVGRSNIVGRPLGMLLLRKAQGGNATVTFCHSQSKDIGSYTRTAEILVAAVGVPEMIKKDMVSPGTVVIDVGVNRINDPSAPKGTRLVGDVAFVEVDPIVKAITPVPGGVGPMTIAMLVKNTAKAARMTLK